MPRMRSTRYLSTTSPTAIGDWMARGSNDTLVNDSSPPALLALVLLLQPRAERREVLDERRCIRAFLPGKDGQRLGPRPALTELQHGSELRARLLVSVDAARVERAGVASRLAERAMELELVDAR